MNGSTENEPSRVTDSEESKRVGQLVVFSGRSACGKIRMCRLADGYEKTFCRDDGSRTRCRAVLREILLEII